MFAEQLVEADVVLPDVASLVTDIVTDEQTFVDLRRYIHADPEIGFDVVGAHNCR